MPWGARQALWGLAGLAGVWVVAIAALAALIAISGTAEEVTPPVWAILGATFVLQAGTVAVGYRLGPYGRGDPALLLGLRRLDTFTLWKWAAAGFLASLAASVTFVTIAERVSSDLVPPPLPEELAGGDLKLLTFLSIVLIAPMAEDLFFRGFLFAGLLRRFGPWGAGLSAPPPLPRRISTWRCWGRPSSGAACSHGSTGAPAPSGLRYWRTRARTL